MKGDQWSDCKQLASKEITGRICIYQSPEDNQSQRPKGWRGERTPSSQVRPRGPKKAQVQRSKAITGVNKPRGASGSQWWLQGVGYSVQPHMHSIQGTCQKVR